MAKKGNAPSRAPGQGVMFAVVGGIAAVAALLLLRKKEEIPPARFVAVGEPDIT